MLCATTSMHTNTWYKVSDYSDWIFDKGGDAFDVSHDYTNAINFISHSSNAYYWHKKIKENKEKTVVLPRFFVIFANIDYF